MSIADPSEVLELERMRQELERECLRIGANITWRGKWISPCDMRCDPGPVFDGAFVSWYDGMTSIARCMSVRDIPWVSADMKSGVATYTLRKFLPERVLQGIDRGRR